MKFRRFLTVVLAAIAMLSATAGAVLALHRAYVHTPRDLQNLAPQAPRIGAGTAATAASSPLDPARRGREPRAPQ
jgi:hypothetical protein